MNREVLENRRRFLLLSGVVGTGLICAGFGSCPTAAIQEAEQQKAKKENVEKGGEVGATEDLMREHGVLRRALLVYTESIPRLRKDSSSVKLDELQKTAKLFRTFGEDYHESILEEPFIFPAVKKAGGPAAAYPDILVAQHQRGREITDYLLAVTQKSRIGAAEADALARVLDQFVLMYRNHAAREDTIIFPAWKQTLTAGQLDEMGDKFEDIEQKMFGKDGFEYAVRRIGEIETSLGFSDPAQFTAPPPPRA